MFSWIVLKDFFRIAFSAYETIYLPLIHWQVFLFHHFATQGTLVFLYHGAAFRLVLYKNHLDV